ncbi:PaaI family thioesterase [Actinomadura viridis]|uniref:PaaI family thioesterase n=1 Tax=Actinomadura viridis TaxID=58110 RepID=UPI00368364C6
MDAANGRPATPGASRVDPHLLETLSGAEFIQALGDGRITEFSHVHTHLGQVIRKAEPGRVELGWQPGERLTNPGGAIHGGYIAMILDNAVCMAGSSTLDRFTPMLTLNLNIDFLRGVGVGETYTVVGTCVHPGRTRMVSNAVITDGRGRTVAQASAAVVPNQAFAR